MTLSGIPLAVTIGSLVMSSAAMAGPLSLEKFFQGRLAAKGQVDNIREGTVRPFTMAMTASWKGRIGTLSEDLVYQDGETKHYLWTFEKTGEGRFTGRRADVTRDAEVIEDDQGVRMTYKADTKLPSGLTLNLAFDDRMKPAGRDSITVESDVSYLFVSAARITMTVTRTAK